VNRPLRHLLTLAALSLPVISCGQAPKQIQTPAQLLAEMQRIRMESLLCLDTFDIEKLVGMTGEATPCAVEVESGNRNFGTLHSIGQLHNPTYETSRAEDDILTRYQLAILRLLLADSARVVFVEGFQAASPVQLDGNLRARLAIAFTPVPEPDAFERLDGPQFQILRNSLAPVVYQALEPRAQIYGADDTSMVRRLMNNEETDPFIADSLRFEYRDRIAMGEVCSYLRDHQGAEVHLVYGAAHIFQRSVVPPGIACPRIVMTTFPGLIAASTGFQVEMVKRLEQKPSLLPVYLDRLKDLNPDCFELMPEAGQLHALGKSFVLTAGVPDPDSLTRFLKRTAKTDAVRAAIDRGHVAYKSRSPAVGY